MKINERERERKHVRSTVVWTGGDEWGEEEEKDRRSTMEREKDRRLKDG